MSLFEDNWLVLGIRQRRTKMIRDQNTSVSPHNSMKTEDWLAGLVATAFGCGGATRLERSEPTIKQTNTLSVFPIHEWNGRNMNEWRLCSGADVNRKHIRAQLLTWERGCTTGRRTPSVEESPKSSTYWCTWKWIVLWVIICDFFHVYQCRKDNYQVGQTEYQWELWEGE